MTLRAKIIAGVGVLAISGGAIYGDIASQPVPVVIDVQLQNPQQIVWNKPTTDAGWAEDVKQESLDLKSTDVLQQMLIDQNHGLDNATSSIAIYTECAQCVKYQLQKDHPEWKQADVDNQFTNDFNDREWMVEKITQSVERIEHELDLRAKGVVVPDKLDVKGTPAKGSDLQKVAPEFVRHIND